MLTQRTIYLLFSQICCFRNVYPSHFQLNFWTIVLRLFTKRCQPPLWPLLQVANSRNLVLQLSHMFVSTNHSPGWVFLLLRKVYLLQKDLFSMNKGLEYGKKRKNKTKSPLMIYIVLKLSQNGEAHTCYKIFKVCLTNLGHFALKI